MYELIIEPEALADLEALKKSNHSAYNQIRALIWDIIEDQEILENMCVNGFDDGILDIKVVQHLQDKAVNAWRLKALATGKYRLIYLYDMKTCYHLVGILHRKEAYSDEMCARIEDMSDDIRAR